MNQLIFTPVIAQLIRYRCTTYQSVGAASLKGPRNVAELSG